MEFNRDDFKDERQKYLYIHTEKRKLIRKALRYPLNQVYNVLRKCGHDSFDTANLFTLALVVNMLRHYKEVTGVKAA